MAQLTSIIAQRLTQQHKTVAVAESCTGGLITHTLTNVAGSSRYFKGGLIAYSDEMKTAHLGISKRIIATHGAVSKEVAAAMAENIRKFARSDFGVSTTGIAGPGGATVQKPVGLVYIGLATPSMTLVKKFLLKGSRLSVKTQAAKLSLQLLKMAL